MDKKVEEDGYFVQSTTGNDFSNLDRCLKGLASSEFLTDKLLQTMDESKARRNTDCDSDYWST